MSETDDKTRLPDLFPSADYERARRPRRIAVIGSGVSGLVASHVLSRHDEVTLFEADPRLGGHAHTHDVDVGGKTIAVDSGFIVHNRRTYPTLIRLFDELGVATIDSEMSLSIRDDELGVEYCGGTGVAGMFPNRAALRPRHVKMLADVPRFYRAARGQLARADAPSGVMDNPETLGEFLDRHRFGQHFRRTFVIPLVAAVWSTEPGRALEYRAEFLFRFLDNHGMLTVLGSPQWRTVAGGSRVYVDKVAEKIAHVRTGEPVHEVVPVAGGVRIDASAGRDTFDAAVVATHSDQALRMLGAPTRAQTEILSALPYQRNEMIMHTDASILPHAKRARAAWNHLNSAPLRTTTMGHAETARGSHRPGREVITYDMNRLQHLDVPGGERILVTLNGRGLVDPAKILRSAEYAHPLYTPESVAARARLSEIDSEHLMFAGAYHGWGFHEDGARSGLRAAEKLGGRWA